MRHLAVIFCFATAVARAWVTFADRSRPLWRTSLTYAAALIFLCALMRYELSTFVDRASPNLTEAVSYSLLILSVGMANVYLDSLVDPHPSWWASRRHLIVSAVLVVVILGSWSQIPNVHDETVRPGVNRLPMSWPLLAFNLAAFGSLLPVGARVIAFCRGKIRANAEADHPEPGAQVGLTLIRTFSLVGMAGCLDVCIVSFLRLPSREALSSDSFHLAFPPLANALCLTGLTSGVIALLVGPRLQERREARRVDRLVSPLWSHLVHLHPHVTLEGHHSAARRLIEVHDALAIHRIPEEESADIYRIATAIREGERGEALAGRALSNLDSSDKAVERLAAAFNERKTSCM